LYLYGNSLKNLCFTPKKKYAFAQHFFDYVIQQELFVYIVLIRLRFINRLKESLLLIRQKLVAVNGNLVIKPLFIIKKGFLLQKCLFKLESSHFRYKKHYWRYFRWKRARYKLRRYYKQRYFNPFWLSKKNLILNYLLCSYISMSAVLIKRPVFSEIFFNFNRKIFPKKQVKRLYSLI